MLRRARWTTLCMVFGTAWASSAAVPDRDRHAAYLFQLSGVPVGVVRLSLRENVFRYESLHLITRATAKARTVEHRQRHAELRLTEKGKDARSGRVPSSLFLWRRPSTTGCVDAVDELSGEQGSLCVERIDAEGSTGLWRTDRYDARYDAAGELVALEMGAATFTRLETGAAALTAPPDLYGEGLPVVGKAGRLTLEGEGQDGPEARPSAVPAKAETSQPPGAAPKQAKVGTQWTEETVRQLAQQVHDELSDRSELTCLHVAQETVRRAQGAGGAAWLVDGLYAAPKDARARPHAWVRFELSTGRQVDVDPTLLVAVVPQTHLPLSAGSRAQAGGVWLEVFSGRKRVVRRKATVK